MRDSVIALGLVLATPYWCPSAWGQTTGSESLTTELTQSEQYAAQAFTAYANRDYASAIALYHKALDLVPSADLLYNIARVYDQGLRDRSLAISFYRRYAEDPDATPERIQKANQRLAELIAAERAQVASAPLPAYAQAEPAPARPLDPSPAPPYWSGLRVAGLITGVVGLAAVGVGTGFGLSAMSKVDTAHAECDGGACRTQRGLDAAKASERHATVATVSVSAGAIALAAGATLWLLSPSGATESPGPEAAVRWQPLATSSQLGLELSGAF